MNNDYYTLIGSLPLLPRFDKAIRLPISQERLYERLKMLESSDAHILSRIEAFLFWKRQVVKESPKELMRQYEDLMALSMSNDLKRFIQTIMTQRTVMVWLRRRQHGLPPPISGELWGLGPLVHNIEKNWSDPDFKMAATFPYIPRARELLAAGDVVGLDKHGGLYIWRVVDELVFGEEFSFIGVFGYVIKWNMVAYWLSFNSQLAEKKFEEIVAEVCSEYEQ
ncbi:MAG: DUF2764 family protein [Candidatus Ancaeobacter aquaticus]|nr:DUF2764 family protein [Candidatus Ancaeobacter aquaticus]